MADSVKEQVEDLVSRGKRRIGLEQPDAADAEGRVGIVRGALSTFGDGDTDGFLDALSNDVVWEAPGSGSFPGGGEHEGRDAVRTEFVENAGRTFTSFGFRPESFVEADDVDAVIVIGRFEGEGVEGDRLDEPGVQIWDFKGNAVVRVRVFTDGAGFPSIVTERKEQEWKEEESKKEQEESEEKDEEKDDDSGASAKKDDDTEGSSDKEKGDSGSDSDEGAEKSGSSG